MPAKQIDRRLAELEARVEPGGLKPFLVIHRNAQGRAYLLGEGEEIYLTEDEVSELRQTCGRFIVVLHQRIDPPKNPL